MICAIILLYNGEIQMKRIVKLTDENCSFRNKHIVLLMFTTFFRILKPIQNNDFIRAQKAVRIIL